DVRNRLRFLLRLGELLVPVFRVSGKVRLKRLQGRLLARLGGDVLRQASPLDQGRDRDGLINAHIHVKATLSIVAARQLDVAGRQNTAAEVGTYRCDLLV